ncbi:MAG: hypothetical protein ACI8PT_004919 [Gammaproteobacteria bacterium]|jgi:hypothetical protein
MAHGPSIINRVTIAENRKPVAFERHMDRWIREGERKAVASDSANAISLAVKFMHTVDPVRIFMPDELNADAISGFGLEAPALSVRLESAEGTVLEADFGGETSGDLLHYMHVKGRLEYFLTSRFILKEWRTVMEAGN